MKILQINACYDKGSTGRMMREMHEYFLVKGYDSYVCFPNNYNGDRRMINIGCKFDYLLHSLFSKLFGLQGYFSIISTLLFLRKISKINPDIIHLHNLHNNYINLPLLFRFLQKHNIATAVTMHDFWFMTGHCCYYTNDNCLKWLKNCGQCPTLKIYNKSWFFDNSLWLRKKKETYFTNLSKLAIIGNSKWTTNESKKSFFNKAQILDHVYNWINTDIFYPRDRKACREKHNFKESDFIILGVAQEWSILKGLDIVEKIAIQKPNYLFILVGEMSDKRYLHSNMISLGIIRDANTLAEIYSLADVYINPSVQETFGLVTAEAISCGLPVIANNATATPELVLPGCGYIIENNNISQILESIEKIKIEKRDAKNMHIEAKREFSKYNIDKYINIYKRLLTDE